MRVMGIPHGFRLVHAARAGAGPRHAADQRLDRRAGAGRRHAGGRPVAGHHADATSCTRCRDAVPLANLVLATVQVGGVRHADRADRLPLRPAHQAQHREPGRRAPRRRWSPSITVVILVDALFADRSSTAWGSDGDSRAAASAPAAAPTARPMVEIRKLCDRVRPARDARFVVHQDLDLRCSAARSLSLVGGSGTGKTVLLRQILGLETAGAAATAACSASRCGAARRACGACATACGMLFQHGALFSAFSVLENIAFPLRELKHAARRADPRRRAGQAADGRPQARATRTRCRPTCRAA